MVRSSADIIREESWKRAIECFGTGAIFQRRARSLRHRIRILVFLALGGPLLLGATVLAFGTKGRSSVLLSILIPATAIVGIAQICASLWALVARWDDSLVEASQSVAENVRLSTDFRDLGVNPPSDLESKFAILAAQYAIRSERDLGQDVSDKERRRGLRMALRQFHRPCVACGLVPLSEKASDCEVCGSY